MQQSNFKVLKLIPRGQLYHERNRTFIIHSKYLLTKILLL